MGVAILTELWRCLLVCFALLRLINQVTVDCFQGIPVFPGGHTMLAFITNVFLVHFRLCRLVHNGRLRHFETIQWSGPWQFKTTHLCQLCLDLWYSAHTLWLFQLQRLCTERSHHWWPTLSLWLLQRLLWIQRAYHTKSPCSSPLLSSIWQWIYALDREAAEKNGKVCLLHLNSYFSGKLAKEDGPHMDYVLFDIYLNWDFHEI